MRKPARRPWTPAEDGALARDYARLGGPAVAKALGRSARSVYHHAHHLGLVYQSRAVADDAFLARLAALHADGLSDAEISARMPCARHTAGRHRRSLGLPPNRLHPRQRARVAARTREQCRAAGVASLAEVRAVAFRGFASASGWPPDLSPREVHILDALDANGPMTRPEIAAAIGMPWIGSRRSLRSRGPGGSYLATLQLRGLVADLGRIVPNGGKGRNSHLYSLSPVAQRSPDHAR